MSASELNTARPEWTSGQVEVDSASDFRLVLEGKASNGGFAIDDFVFSTGRCPSECKRNSTCTLCFIFRVPLARKSITFICRQALLIAGCQIEGMTTSKNCTQGFFPMIHQSGIVCTLLALLKKWNRVLDWYEKMQICSFSKNDILQLIFIFLLELSWFNILVCVYNLRMPGWNTGKRHNLYFYL